MPVKVAAQRHAPPNGKSIGPPVVIVHGLFGCARNWRSLCRQLASRYEVHALDMRNHGASPHDDAMTYADMASDIVKYLDDTMTELPVLIGHSMGGKAAMHLALGHGDRLSKLIVVDIAPVPNHQGFQNLLEAMTEVDTKAIRGRDEAEEALSSRVPDKSLRQFLLQNLVRADHDYRWRLNLHALRVNMNAILDFPTPELWQVFEKPTLFIRGQRSPYVRPEHNQPIKALFPNTDLVTIADAGHWVHAEQPQRFLDEVCTFLQA